MIIVNKQDTKQILLSMEYRNENELRDVFVSSRRELLSGVDTIEAKSFICVKELDGVDVTLIGNDGSIFLVETKLARNNDARHIVAQLLSYAAKLKSRSFKDFENHWIRRPECKSKTLLAELENSFESGNEVLDQLRENWEKRRFNLILIMDKINDEIREMAETLKDIPNWFIYGIELTKYSQNDQKDFKIFVPNVLWEEEVKKSQQIRSDQEFIDPYTEAGMGKEIKDFISLFREFEENKKSIDNIEVYRTPCVRNYKTSNGGVTISLHYDPNYEGGNIQFWCNKIGLDGKVIEILRQYEGMGKIKPIKNTFGKVAEWDLKYFSKEIFEEILQKISKIE